MSNVAHAELLKNARGSAAGDEADYLLALGGPLYQLYLRTRLVRYPLELTRRRVCWFIAICWVPLLLISVLTGRFVAGATIPFLFDAEVHAKSLGMLPLLVGAEWFVHQRVRLIVRQFLERKIIAEDDWASFEELVASAMRLRNSTAAEIVMLLVAFAAGYWVWSHHLVLGLSSWWLLPGGGGMHLTPAGYWYAFVSQPILRFLILRWYFRLFIWYRFLWKVRALPLRLNHFHPDKAGGLGFLAESVFAFSPILVAHSIVVAGTIGNQIWHRGARLTDYKTDIIGATALLALAALAPLSFVAGHLMFARRTARREFGALASRYVNEFRRKWIQGGGSPAEPLLGTADIQSLADLANSYTVVSEMRILPFQPSTVVRLLVLLVSPITPLVLTMVPLDELISRLIKFVV